MPRINRNDYIDGSNHNTPGIRKIGRAADTTWYRDEALDTSTKMIAEARAEVDALQKANDPENQGLLEAKYLELVGYEENVAGLELQKKREDIVERLHDIITAPTATNDQPFSNPLAPNGSLATGNSLEEGDRDLIEAWVKAINQGGTRGDYAMHKGSSYQIPPMIEHLYSEKDRAALQQGIAELRSINGDIEVEERSKVGRIADRMDVFYAQLQSNQVEHSPAQESETKQSKSTWESVKEFFSNLAEKISNFFSSEAERREPTKALKNLSKAVRANEIDRTLSETLGVEHTPIDLAQVAKDNGVPDKAA